MRRNRTPRRLASNWLPSLAILLLSGLAPLNAQYLAPPESLWSIATGEKIPGADLLKTKQFGPIIAGAVMVRRPGRMSSSADIQGLQPGDVVLAMDGLRVYGSREYQLVRFRNALSTTMDLLVNRDGDLTAIKLHDLQPGRAIGVEFNIPAEQDRILAAMESLGLPLLDEKVRNSLLHLPDEAAAQLSEWSKDAPANADTAWINEFIDLFVAVQNREYAQAKKPVNEPPIPYFKRLEKFYLDLADRNKEKELPPDLKASGETPEFYALALPVPTYEPPLGNVRFSDRRFTSLLLRKAASGDRPDPELATAAAAYVDTGSNSLDQYLGQVRAALLDPENMGGWPYRSYLLGNVASRNLLIDSLNTRMNDPKNPDWALDAYAMIAMKFMMGANNEIPPLLTELYKRSPYLARSSASSLFDARHMTRSNWNGLNGVKKVLADNNDLLGDNAPALYRWALDKVQPAVASMQLTDVNALLSPRRLLTTTPYAIVKALTAPPAAPSPAPSAAASPAEAKTE